jgi:glycosyltransferase involved in cell wall biosynthesis
MRILFLSQYFYPETFKGNDLVFELKKRGHDVIVVTGKPNYPEGRFFAGYGFFKKNVEVLQGVTVYRLPLIPRGKGAVLGVALNYLSFYVSSRIFFIFGKPDFKADVIIGQQLSPVTSSIPGLWYKNKLKVPLITWVLDLWPESLIANSPIKKGIVIDQLEKMVKRLYHGSDLLLMSSRSFEGPIQSRGVDHKKLSYFPNWAEDVFSSTPPSEKTFPPLPAGFNIVYAGNLGESQDFPNVIKAIQTLGKGSGINWIFVGGGRFADGLKQLASEQQLDNVYLYPPHPVDFMPSLFKQANAMLLTLKGGSMISQTVPAKMQTYMSAGKMILAMIDGEAHQLMIESDCGWVAQAGDYSTLAKNARSMASMSLDEVKLKEDNSLSFYQKYFTKDQAISKVEMKIKELVSNDQA